jgi:ABC-type antimicrobial peptide transport system permease subunit
MTSVFLYVGLGLAIFSMFLFYNFISISINNKKREIGILRAVGAKRGDVFKIFYSESFIIALINFILSVAATIALSIILNMNFQQNANVSFAIMKPSFITYGLLLAISLFTSILAALIPVVRLANKKPIDAIQNR